MYRISKTSVIISLILSVSLLFSGCTEWSKTAKGGVIGGGAGAAAGAVIGKTLGNTAAGALAGAAVGGTVGAIIGRQMDKKAAELERNLEGAEIQRVEEGIAVSFDSGLLFDFDSAKLRPEAMENLKQLAEIMGEDDNTELLIVGHTDSVGDENYNQNLSERRAAVAATFMGTQGIARSRIQVEGMGETEPIADNDTEAGRQENRRIEVAVYASDDYIEELEEAQ
ncbi:OmpA family protein [Rhodohalobacter sp. 614A]|uniref:OmpA family protein n=1 Tax=Rhodohalobacter sp. 614A TaxID=2908649 RepID=UPI001F176A1E|nr:OmpA family protein [Rhodohalobacter sp. 614A]